MMTRPSPLGRPATPATSNGHSEPRSSGQRPGGAAGSVGNLPPGDPALGIDPALDAEGLAPIFHRLGRLHLPGFLSGSGASALVAALASAEGWTISTMGERSPFDIPIEAVVADETAAEALIASARSAARSGFHYLFESLRISDLVDSGVSVPAPLETLYRWLNGDAFLSFAREISGEADLHYVDAQATRYWPGHYLNEHDDELPDSGRRLAYVLNLSPAWRASWGGLLAFVDEDGHVAEAYTPTFNALNLFRVPQTHLVSQVAAFAGGPRLSVAGWIRTAR